MKDIVEIIVEIPYRSRNKYEIDSVTGRIKLDRVLYSALSYPGEYGFINNTLSDDGDSLDILIIAENPTFPGCIVDARVIGYLDVIDNNEGDQKVIAVLAKDPRTNQINEINDLPEHQLIEIKDFFQNYKNLQGIKVVAKDFHTRLEAEELIKKTTL